jgi:hypothetical protein
MFVLIGPTHALWSDLHKFKLRFIILLIMVYYRDKSTSVIQSTDLFKRFVLNIFLFD